MQDRTDAGQDICRTGECRTGQKQVRTGQMQDWINAGHRQMYFRTDAGKDECRTGQMLDVGQD